MTGNKAVTAEQFATARAAHQEASNTLIDAYADVMQKAMVDLTQAVTSLDWVSSGPAWVYVVGPIGSGKSTILRTLTADAVGSRPVVVLQLQRDNSRGYAAGGAAEYYNEAEFKAHVEQIARHDADTWPLLIIDGLGPEAAQRLSKWIRGLPAASAMQIICATLHGDVTMAPAWGPAAITIRVDAQRVRGLATGTIQEHSSGQTAYWEMALASQPQVDRAP